MRFAGIAPAHQRVNVPRVFPHAQHRAERPTTMPLLNDYDQLAANDPSKSQLADPIDRSRGVNVRTGPLFSTKSSRPANDR
jgi:hypothetical protein